MPRMYTCVKGQKEGEYLGSHHFVNWGGGDKIFFSKIVLINFVFSLFMSRIFIYDIFLVIQEWTMLQYGSMHISDC